MKSNFTNKEQRKIKIDMKKKNMIFVEEQILHKNMKNNYNRMAIRAKLK